MSIGEMEGDKVACVKKLCFVAAHTFNGPKRTLIPTMEFGVVFR